MTTSELVFNATLLQGSASSVTDLSADGEGLSLAIIRTLAHRLATVVVPTAHPLQTLNGSEG